MKNAELEFIIADPVLNAFVQNGLVDATRMSRELHLATHPLTKQEQKMPEEITLVAVAQDLARLVQSVASLASKVDSIVTLLQSRPAPVATSGAKPAFQGNRGGGAKKKVPQIVGAPVTVTAPVKMVWENAYPSGTQFAIQIADGPKVSTWDEALGKLAVANQGTGTELTFVYGTNAKGYLDVLSISPAAADAGVPF